MECLDIVSTLLDFFSFDHLHLYHRVICPLALVEQWASEVTKMTNLRVLKHHCADRTTGFHVSSISLFWKFSINYVQIRQYWRNSILLLRLTTLSNPNMQFSIRRQRMNLKVLPKPRSRRILTMIPTPLTLDIRRRGRPPEVPRRNVPCMVFDGGASSLVCVSFFPVQLNRI